MKKNTFALPCILGISLFLNMYGIQWGLPSLWYPDEPETIEDIVLPMARNLDPNPHNFYKPTLYYYFLGAVLSPYLAYHRLAYFQDPSYESYLSAVALISRTATALVGVLGVFLIYLIGKTIAGLGTGLFAAALLASNLGWAAYSHFAYMDIPMTALLLAACYFGIRYIDTVQIKWLYRASVFAGLSISTKYNAALPAVLILSACHLSRAMSDGRTKIHFSQSIRGFFSRELFVSVLLCVTVFFIASPFILLDFRTFLLFLQKQMGVSQGFKVFEESRVWLKNILLLKEAFGAIPFVLVGSLFLFGILRIFKKPDLKILLVFSIPVVYWAYVSTWKIIAFRYVLPLVPFIILAACASFRPPGKKWMRMIGVILGIAVLFSIMNSSIGISWFGRDTRKSAESWIAENMPPQSRVETYAYKMYLPKFPGNLNVYRIKADYISEVTHAGQNTKSDSGSASSPLSGEFSREGLRLRNPDYLVLSGFYEERYLSRKDGRPPLYPELTNYFDQLMAGQSGYRIIARFEKNKMHNFYVNPTILIFARGG